MAFEKSQTQFHLLHAHHIVIEFIIIVHVYIGPIQKILKSPKNTNSTNDNNESSCLTVSTKRTIICVHGTM